MRVSSFAAATFLFAGLALAQSGSAAPQDPPAAEPKPTLAQMLAKFHPTEGTVKLSTMAEVKLAPGWVFLAGEDGRSFLRECGNRPGPETLGVVMAPDFADSGAFAVYSYSAEGHVDDADDPDYDELLAEMKEGTVEQSKQRKQAGLGTIELLGWAEPPHYDKAQHKLYWAERLQFGDHEGVTLNYNVRVLGRTGHLVVNGVGDIEQLALVAALSKQLLAATEFVEGQRYENFDPAYDKVAAYGIGGLVAGSMAMKLGLFAKLGVLLKVFIKPILIGVVVIGGLLWKVLSGRKARAKNEAPAA